MKRDEEALNLLSRVYDCQELIGACVEAVQASADAIAGVKQHWKQQSIRQPQGLAPQSRNPLLCSVPCTIKPKSLDSSSYAVTTFSQSCSSVVPAFLRKHHMLLYLETTGLLVYS